MSFQRRDRFMWVVVSFIALGALPLRASLVKAQTPGDVFYNDLWQTVQARKLLLDDPQLGRLNLGVKVTNRTAVLWGPVPSQQLSIRAEQRLRTMFELIDIRNRLTIEPDDDAAPPALAIPETPRFLPDEPPSVVPATPGVPRLPLPQPSTGVALAGIVTPEDMLTARSSPLSGSQQAGAGLATWHLPFLGSISLPR